MTPPLRATVTSYLGYRVNDTQGRVEIYGINFGTDIGRVQLKLVNNPVGHTDDQDCDDDTVLASDHGHGHRRYRPNRVTILSWTDTKIVVATPSYRQYRSLMVIPKNGKAFNLTNINPPISTYCLPQVAWITGAHGGVAAGLEVVGHELNKADSLLIETDGGSSPLTYYKPTGPNAGSNPASGPGFGITWTDTLVSIHDSTDLNGAEIFEITPQDVDGNQNGSAFDPPESLVLASESSAPTFVSASSPFPGVLSIVGTHLGPNACVYVKSATGQITLSSTIATDPHWWITPTEAIWDQPEVLSGQTITKIVWDADPTCIHMDLVTDPDCAFSATGLNIIIA